MIQLFQGDCLEVMKTLPDSCVDLVLCDLPYGTTQCKWDAVIPLSELWRQYERIAKENAAIVLTAAQPFTSVLITSNLKDFKYAWVWDKVNGIRNHLNAKKQPMRCTEDVCVFYRSQPIYNPQMREGGYTSRKTKPGQSDGFGTVTGVDFGKKVTSLYPINLVAIKSHDPNNSFHPTQKPVALMEYMIKTYTNEFQTVLDNTMGSGTTGVACANLGRKFIGIERDSKYFEIAKERIEQAEINRDF
jgi:site-specific DNA-methyltransferase (adenine-specific)